MTPKPLQGLLRQVFSEMTLASERPRQSLERRTTSRHETLEISKLIYAVDTSSH